MRLEWLVILIFFLILLVGVIVPIYADEVALRMMKLGFFSQDQRMLTLLPQCHSNLGYPIPWSWFPAAIGTALLFGDMHPMGIRMLGISIALVWLSLLVFLLVSLVSGRQRQISWLSAALATLGVGVLPLFLVFSRPEQWLLLFLTLFIIFPFISKIIGWVPSNFGYTGLLVIYCLLVSLTFFAHPKALFFLPLLGVSAYYSFFAKSRFVFLVAIAFLLWTGFQTIEVFHNIFACPDAPVFAATFLKSQTQDFTMFFQNPLATLRELLTNLVLAPKLLLKHYLFQSDYQSNWLPSLPTTNIGKFAKLVNLAISTELMLVIWAGLLLPLVTLVIAIKQRASGAMFMLLAALWIGFAGHLAIYKVWNFNTGSFVVCLSVLLIVLSAVQVQWTKRACLVGRWLCTASYLIFLASASVLALQVVPGLFQAIGSANIGLKNQPLSVPTFGFSEQRDKIRKFADKCALSGNGARRLVVDDLTYFAFDNLKEPLHLVYFYELAYGVDIKGEPTTRMLEGLGAEGIVAQCTFMPSLLMKQARKDGNLCCIKFPLENAIH
jgi:hypothetical protein